MIWARRLVPVLPLIVAVIGFAVLLNDDSTPDEVDTPFTVDIATVPTERLEGILESARTDPAFADEIAGILLILAERHFTDGDYESAFGRYAEVLENPTTRRPQFAVALSRVAWIGWLSTGDTTAALASLDESLRLAPDNSETYYIKGQILWCGAKDSAAAIELFRAVLRAPDLPDEVRAQIAGDLRAAESGESCR